MSLKILLVTATNTEAESVTKLMGTTQVTGKFTFMDFEIEILVTGVGSISTAWAMSTWFSRNSKPDLVINAGIAGSYRSEIGPGKVVVPVSDCFADSGIETSEGYMTIFEAGLEDPDRFPFKAGRLIAENRFVQIATENLKPVNAITVNTASGSGETIEKLKAKFNPGIETMEGATFFYICTGEGVPFLAIRAVSNMVEPRNRDKWEIPLALSNLSEEVKRFIIILKEQYEN
jgi:futalosine hydrolase